MTSVFPTPGLYHEVDGFLACLEKLLFRSPSSYRQFRDIRDMLDLCTLTSVFFHVKKPSVDRLHHQILHRLAAFCSRFLEALDVAVGGCDFQWLPVPVFVCTHVLFLHIHVDRVHHLCGILMR